MIGERIRKKRRELEMSQQALARMVGVSRVTITDWENSKTELITLVAC